MPDTGSAGWRRAGACLALLLLLTGLGLWLAGCGGGASTAARARAALPARWLHFRHIPGVVDLAGPRSDGRLAVAAGGRLFLLGRSGQPVPFARGSGGYSTALGPEPYIALATGTPVTGMHCSFGQNVIYALQPNAAPGVISISERGQARRFAILPGVRPDGITFDDVGRFGYRLLVTATARGGTTVFGVDCAGHVTVIASRAPRLEGGIAIAPRSFGSFGGELIAPDETTGRVWAIGPGGKASLVARSPLPSGGDIGAESAAFVPDGFSRSWAAYVADRGTPGNRHPGTDSILRLPGSELTRARARSADLIVASEGGAQTIVISCSATCTVRHIADGPAAAHIEGHIVFAPAPH